MLICDAFSEMGIRDALSWLLHYIWMSFALLCTTVPGLDVCGPGLEELPELFSSTARAGVINAGVGKAHSALQEVVEEEPREGGQAPCGFPLAIASPCASFLPVPALSARPAEVIPTVGMKCSPKAIIAISLVVQLCC